MNEWKEVVLKDVITHANTGLDAIKRAPIVEQNTGIKCLRIQDVSQKKDFENWGFTNVEERNYTKFQLKKDEIIIARTGATIGVTLFIKEDLKAVFNNGLIKLKVDKSVCHPQYLYYSLTSKYYKDFIESISGGTSTQPNMQIGVLLSYDLLLPPLHDQVAIAEVLSSIDDKIDLLNGNNNTLENLVETLFRNEYEDKYLECCIEEEFNVTMGQSPPGNTYNEELLGMKFYQGRTDFGFRFPEPRIYTTEPKRLANAFDTLISVRAPVGDLNITNENCCIGRGLAAVRHKNKDVHYSYSYNVLRTLQDSFNMHDATGTIFGSITKDDLLKLKCFKLPINRIEFYNNEIGTLEDKITSNALQIRKLEILRNTLLPKLMSGAVRVNI